MSSLNVLIPFFYFSRPFYSVYSDIKYKAFLMVMSNANKLVELVPTESR